MSLVGIVTISVLAALFLFALLAGLGLQIWQSFQNKKLLLAVQAEFKQVSVETKTVLAQNWADTKVTLQTHQAEQKSQVESAKSAFGAIRNEVRSLLDESRKELGITLEKHRAEMQSGIDKINAEALVSVAARLTQVCLRAEKAVSVLQEMMLDTEARAAHDYGPNDYAPEENPFGAPPSGYSVSKTTALDEQAIREEINAFAGADGS